MIYILAYGTYNSSVNPIIGFASFERHTVSHHESHLNDLLKKSIKHTLQSRDWKKKLKECLTCINKDYLKLSLEMINDVVVFNHKF